MCKTDPKPPERTYNGTWLQQFLIDSSSTSNNFHHSISPFVVHNLNHFSPHPIMQFQGSERHLRIYCFWRVTRTLLDSKWFVNIPGGYRNITIFEQHENFPPLMAIQITSRERGVGKRATATIYRLCHCALLLISALNCIYRGVKNWLSNSFSLNWISSQRKITTGKTWAERPSRSKCGFLDAGCWTGRGAMMRGSKLRVLSHPRRERRMEIN